MLMCLCVDDRFHPHYDGRYSDPLDSLRDETDFCCADSRTSH